MIIALAVLILYLLVVGWAINNPAPPYKIKPIPHG
jgi:hypothetical protein